MGAPQAHGIPPQVLAAVEKKQFEESSHYIPSDCLCEPATSPGRESKQSLFVSKQLEASKRGTKLLSTQNPPSHFVGTNEGGFGVSLVGPSALESEGEW